MANFTLNWLNPNVSSNVINQRADYRQRTVGGAYLITGFSPTNDLAPAARSTTINNLLWNVAYQFQQANICTVGGPTYNTAGMVEFIKYQCTAITAVPTDSTVLVTVSGLPDDINSVILTNNGVNQTVVPISGTASFNFGNLTASTAYTATAQYGSIINGIQYMDPAVVTCSLNYTTNAPVQCPAPTNLTVI